MYRQSETEIRIRPTADGRFIGIDRDYVSLPMPAGELTVWLNKALRVAALAAGAAVKAR